MVYPADTSKMSDKERSAHYECEDALRTLTRAEEIMADKALMKRVRAMAGEKIEMLERIEVPRLAGLISPKQRDKLEDKYEHSRKAD